MQDDDDVAVPLMLSVYMKVAQRLDPDVLTDLSDNFDVQPDGHWAISHRSLAVGNAFAHNFFVNNYGKANFCVKPAAGLAVGGHHTGARSESPYVDWGFFSRASLHGLQIETIPLALYNYAKRSPNSIFYSMNTQSNRYDGHAKMLDDVADLVPPAARDILLYCRYALSHPRVEGDGVF